MIESGEQVPNDILTHILRIICEQYYIANHDDNDNDNDDDNDDNNDDNDDTVIHDVATNYM